MKHRINIGFETKVDKQQDVRALIEACAKRVLVSEGVGFAAQIDVTVVDADTIRWVNAEQRGKDAVTDVLSFPMYAFYNGKAQEELESEPDTGCVMLGDMLLCYTRACEQAEAFGHSPARECGYLTTHSVLHLLGYDHERNDEDTKLMRAKEEGNLAFLGLTRDT
ncbi:MAG: rRNA maturation RNase YbeY [Agathobaculum sp.]|uniref:rRNA maturation RNase YbeY n=1 Tax=Agathobaculum sp. TaxID=2048138 RepID=UPI0025C08427|nr:rRNA maturation RNase YbeY [Agathobaculum sp.]MCI7126615.1 rRNA maturation RNase YbeY [Agathobaculum sp.]MDY3712584.1 rRNA maturation RNase YbeY [Agathobaculum sp.]